MNLRGARWARLLARRPDECPRPDKYAYATKSDAKLALRRMRGTDRTNMHAYHCACGSFHLGHRRAA